MVGGDQKAAFYAWALPPQRRGLMAICWPVPGWALGKPDVSQVWLASQVIPVGWINSVSPFQHLHRQIGLNDPPLGAGPGKDMEIRRDRPIPVNATSAQGSRIPPQTPPT